MSKTISDDEFYSDDYAERLPLLAESMMGNPRMAHDIRAAHEEVMRLRALITAWAVADGTRGECNCGGGYCTSAQALRKAVGR